LVKPEEIKDLENLKKIYDFYFVPVTSLAESLNTPLLANLCVVGAFLRNY